LKAHGDIDDQVLDMDDSKGQADEWIYDKETITRVHARPRTELFTPKRVPGAPSLGSIAKVRITEGVFCDNNSRFRRVDSWATRATAHGKLSRPWTGSSKFLSLAEL
jgi:hypothetical protein